MLPINWTSAFTNMPTTTIETAGVLILCFLGNHELIPNSDVHLTTCGICLSSKRSTLPLSSSSDLGLCLSS